MHSAIYEGTLHHCRRTPVEHRFAYPLYLMYLDLDELAHVFDGRWLWSARRPAPAWFRRRDFLGDAAETLPESVRRRVAEVTGERPEGPIRLLTQLRLFGTLMNPVSFYYCFAESGEQLAAIVAEVTNTPWGERHAYVLDRSSSVPGSTDARRWWRSLESAKRLHVSPFMPMDVAYRWRFDLPGETLAVHIENLREGQRMFEAHLALKRRPINGRELARALVVHPLMSLRVGLWIYLQAVRLHLKGALFHTHPKKIDSVQQTKAVPGPDHEGVR
ncbi:MAG: DUF1365 domain-containing protein [Acidobacteriota bacterium]